MHFAERFLTDPGRRARAARRWGGRSLLLSFTGGPYSILGMSPLQEEALRDRFGSYCLPAAEQDGIPVEIEVLSIAPEAFRELPTRGWEMTFDFDFQASEIWMAGLSLLACIHRGRHAGARLWTPFTGGQAFQGAVENVLRVVCAYRLLAARGLLLHSAAVVVHGRALVLAGQSGAGKSTFAALAAAGGLEVVSDDLNAVSFHGDQPMVTAVPFAGDYRPSPRPHWSGLPLGAVGRLVKAPTDAVTPLSPVRAFAALLAHAPYVNQDPAVRPALMDAVEGLTSRCPAISLAFTRRGDIDLIRGSGLAPS